MMTGMDHQGFWALIGAAKAASAGDIHRHEVLLQAELDHLPLPEVVGFQRVLEALDAESFRVDLWGAVEVIEERISEDHFFGFRGWLVAQGRAVFEAVVGDPDALADVPGLRAGALPFADRIWGVALEVYLHRTDGELPEAWSGWTFKPAGTWWPWEEHAAQLRCRYPRLWARFRQAPPGLDPG
jgi:Protein of unknown function (DUF4240)